MVLNHLKASFESKMGPPDSVFSLEEAWSQKLKAPLPNLKKDGEPDEHVPHHAVHIVCDDAYLRDVQNLSGNKAENIGFVIKETPS